jgi:hypothetical protein
MTIMRVATTTIGATLAYDTDDVKDITISTPSDVIDITEAGDKFHRRELGQAHLDLHIDFRPGKKPFWIDEADDAASKLSAIEALEVHGGEFIDAAELYRILGKPIPPSIDHAANIRAMGDADA